jgi:hypothetical protein
MWLAIGLTAAVSIQVAGLSLISRLVNRLTARPEGVAQSWQIAIMGLVVYLLFVLHLGQITIYAAIYMVTGAIQSVHTALYFSAATFTTIGGGKVQTEEPWQFFAALQGLSGIIMVGWSIAFLVAVTHRLGMWTPKPSEDSPPNPHIAPGCPGSPRSRRTSPV